MTVGQAAKRIAWVLAVFAVLWVFRVTISFSAMCPKCLQYAHGFEIRLLGIPCYYRVKPSQTHHGLGSPDAFTERVPPIDPKLYQKIMGKRCRHEYQKLGFCRYSFGKVGCGGGGPSPWAPRVMCIEEIYRAYQRFGDRYLAQQSFRIVNSEVASSRSEERKWRELDAFWHRLKAVASRDEWADLIALQQSAERLKKRMQQQAVIPPHFFAYTNAPFQIERGIHDPGAKGGTR